MEAGAEKPTAPPPANNAALVTDSAPASHANKPRDSLGILVMALVMIALAALLIWPWIPQTDPVIAERNRYQPLSHGQAMTRVILDNQGVPQAWISENTVAIPAWEVFGDNFPATIATHLLTHLPDLATTGQYAPSTELFHIRSRTHSRDGLITTSGVYLLRHSAGDDILAGELPDIDAPLLYDPPFRISASVDAPAVKQSGIYAGVFTYTITTTVTFRLTNATLNNASLSNSEQVTTPFGMWNECRQRTAHYTLDSGTDTTGASTATYLCAGQGPISEITLDGEGNSTSTAFALVNLGGADPETLRTYLPPARPLPSHPSATTSLTPSQSWELSRVARIAPPDRTRVNSIAPVYVAAASPYLLTAARYEPLRALDPDQPDTVLWEFQTSGTIYSQPTVDPQTGRIYFGNSDKHLYALTGEGIFLWRVPMRDNIAAQPLVMNDAIEPGLVTPSLVIVTAEDGSVYAIDSASGAVQWNVALGAVSVAAPSSLTSPQGILIAVGGDDGVVQALEVASGEVVWEASVDGAIQAPLRVGKDEHYGDILYVATTGATLHVFTSDGNLLWSAQLLAAVRTAPSLDTERLYLVDTAGWLYAIARGDGQLIWRSDQPRYLGPPIRLTTIDAGNTHEGNTHEESELLIVASDEGTISAFSTQGELLRQWQAGEVNTSSDQRHTSFTLGPTLGGGALWFGDDYSIVHRLGPSPTAP